MSGNKVGKINCVELKERLRLDREKAWDGITIEAVSMHLPKSSQVRAGKDLLISQYLPAEPQKQAGVGRRGSAAARAWRHAWHCYWEEAVLVNAAAKISWGRR